MAAPGAKPGIRPQSPPLVLVDPPSLVAQARLPPGAKKSRKKLPGFSTSHPGYPYITMIVRPLTQWPTCRSFPVALPRSADTKLHADLPPRHRPTSTSGVILLTPEVLTSRTLSTPMPDGDLFLGDSLRIPPAARSVVLATSPQGVRPWRGGRLLCSRLLRSPSRLLKTNLNRVATI